MLNAYDRVWSYIGPPLTMASVSFLGYARSGTFIPENLTKGTGDDARIEASYLGMLIASGSLLLLGFVADRYVRNRPPDRIGEPPWPRLIFIEEEGRDPAISRIGFMVLVGIPLISWFVCAIKYSESRITPWNGKTTADALANGFWESRWKALTTAPFGHPQFHVHPPNGFQYIPCLTDLVLIILAGWATFVWIRWIRLSYLSD
jgi:hypothetical protein